jgi:hypothetical protein
VCSPRPVASKVAADTPLLLTGHVFGDSYPGPRPCVCRDLLVIIACSKNKKKILFLLCSVESFHISHAK